MKLLFLLTISLLSIDVFTQGSINGEWILKSKNDSKLIFKENGEFEYYLNDAIFNPPGFEHMQYGTFQTNHENMISVVDQSGSLFTTFKYEVDGCNLLIAFYKTGSEEIMHDIDEFGWYQKDDCKNQLSKPDYLQTFIVPDYFASDFYITYIGLNEFNRQNEVFTLPPDGLLNLPFKANPFNILKGSLIFKTSKGDIINQFIVGSTLPHDDPNKLYVKIIGFNQTSRDHLKDKFGINEKVRDVLQIKIGLLKELISDD